MDFEIITFIGGKDFRFHPQSSTLEPKGYIFLNY